MREKKRQRVITQKGYLSGYKQFSATEKVKLKIMYPFLSAGQITGKIKEKWKILCIQRNNKKTTAKLTSTESKNRRKSRNTNLNSMNNMNIDVSDTPEFVNEQKLHDFRKSHEEKYDNDFITNPGRLSSLKNNKMVKLNQPTSTMGLEYYTKATMNDMNSGTFNVDSDDDTCSDADDAVLIKRNFDVNGNIVDNDSELELSVSEDITQNNNLAHENLTSDDELSEDSVIKENEDEHCPNKTVDDCTKQDMMKSCGNKSTLDRCLERLRSTGVRTTSSSTQKDEVADEISISDMFSEVTSPGTDSKGHYKTKRMVKQTTKSDAQIMSQQFEQLFNEENDFIFLN